MKKQTFTLGQVANAIGVPRHNLLAWAQRHYLPFLDSKREDGAVRRFDVEQVAFTQAFAVIATHGDAIHAAEVMRAAIEGTTNAWDKRASRSISEGASLYILVKRYWRNGVSELDVEVSPTLEQVEAFDDSTVTGELVGAEVDNDPPCHVAVFSVGRAINKAAERLLRP